jgi:hypothetical protein
MVKLQMIAAWARRSDSELLLMLPLRTAAGGQEEACSPPQSRHTTRCRAHNLRRLSIDAQEERQLVA